MRNKFLLLILFITPFCGYSQNINSSENDTLKFSVDGIVMDYLTNEPINGATIKIISSNGSVQKELTDS